MALLAHGPRLVPLDPGGFPGLPGHTDVPDLRAKEDEVVVNDRERLLALLRDFGLTPSEYGDAVVRLAVSEGGVEGYTGLFCDFVFMNEGEFAEVGVWE